VFAVLPESEIAREKAAGCDATTTCDETSRMTSTPPHSESPCDDRDVANTSTSVGDGNDRVAKTGHRRGVAAPEREQLACAPCGAMEAG